MVTLVVGHEEPYINITYTYYACSQRMVVLQ